MTLQRSQLPLDEYDEDALYYVSSDDEREVLSEFSAVIFEDKEQ